MLGAVSVSASLLVKTFALSDARFNASTRGVFIGSRVRVYVGGRSDSPLG